MRQWTSYRSITLLQLLSACYCEHQPEQRISSCKDDAWASRLSDRSNRRRTFGWRDRNMQWGVRRWFTTIQNNRLDVADSVTNDRACSNCGTAVEGGYKGAFGVRDEDAPKRVNRAKAAGIVRGRKKELFFNSSRCYTRVRSSYYTEINNEWFSDTNRFLYFLFSI